MAGVAVVLQERCIDFADLPDLDSRFVMIPGTSVGMNFAVLPG